MDDYRKGPRRPSQKPYARFSLPGWIHILLGVLCLGLGLLDLIWTILKYGADCNIVPDATFKPCEANHIFTYVASPIWGAVFMVICGVCGAAMSPARLMHTKWLFYVHVATAILVAFIVCPAIIVLNIFEIIYGFGFFLTRTTGLQITAYDDLKLALPIALAILGVLEFINAMISMLIGCILKPKEVLDRDDDYHMEKPPPVEDYRPRYPPPAIITRYIKRSHPHSEYSSDSSNTSDYTPPRKPRREIVRDVVLAPRHERPPAYRSFFTSMPHIVEKPLARTLPRSQSYLWPQVRRFPPAIYGQPRPYHSLRRF